MQSRHSAQISYQKILGLVHYGEIEQKMADKMKLGSRAHWKFSIE